MSEGEDPFEGPEETRIDVGGREVLITRDDAREMKTALLTALEESEVEDRDLLIETTKDLPGWIDSDGQVRIGAWLLQPKGGALALTYRMAAGTNVAKGYVAFLERRREQWGVTAIQVERIRVRR